MTLQQFLQAIQDSAIGEWMRYTPRAMPVVEAVHVLGAVMVFGTMLVVDLRLLGLADARRAFRRLSRQWLPLAWGAFGISAITGALMFTTSTLAYAANPAFQLKMLALLGAGLNMAFFQAVILRDAAKWERDVPSRAARIAGLTSIMLWAAIVLLGRWIGFTKGYDLSIPPGTGLDFGD